MQSDENCTRSLKPAYHINSDCTSLIRFYLNAEIKRRIGQAKTAFMEMRRVLSASTISIEIRKRLIKCYVWSILTYGSEAWTYGTN